MHDVIVIGAGPVGSQVACRLAEMGYRVVVLERNGRLGERVCCSGIVGRECANSFSINGGVVLRAAKSARLFSPSGRMIHLRRDEPQAYIVDRAALNLELAGRAKEKGADYVLGCLCKDVKVHDDRVSVEAVSQGKSLYFEARAAVLATGFAPGLTEKLGLGKIGDFVTGAQAEVETCGLDEIEVYFGSEIAPGFFGWLVPTQPDRALVGLLSRRSPGLYLRKLMSSLSAEGKIVLDGQDISYGAIPLKPLPRTYTDRVLAAGDAAGLVKPTTGGGVYYGLMSANLAADTLSRALEAGNLSADGLAGYERKWKSELGRELQVGFWGRKLYERLSDRQVDKAFDVILSDGVLDSLLGSPDVSFDWHSEAVLKLVGHHAVSRVLRVVKAPLHLAIGKSN